MKASEGVTRPGPVVGFVMLFVVGAVLQARAMQTADMGIVYIAVLGLEATLAIVLSAAVLGERITWERGLAVLLVIAGVALLRRS